MTTPDKKAPPTLKAIFEGIEPERLPRVIDTWLWEFDEPQNWPTDADVREAIKELLAREDAATVPVRSAIQKCLKYIGIKAVP